MHVLSSCVFIHLSVSLSISLCDTNHLSACPQICPARARRTSMFWATRKQSCPFLFGDIATIILLTATSGDTESYYTGTKNISEAKLFLFTVKKEKRKKEKNWDMRGNCRRAVLSLWRPLQRFGSFGFWRSETE